MPSIVRGRHALNRIWLVPRAFLAQHVAETGPLVFLYDRSLVPTYDRFVTVCNRCIFFMLRRELILFDVAMMEAVTSIVLDDSENDLAAFQVSPVDPWTIMCVRGIAAAPLHCSSLQC